MVEHGAMGIMGDNPTAKMLIAAGVSSHVFEDQFLVFSETNQTLYDFNHSAAFMWCCFEEGMSEPEVAHAVCSVFGVEIDRARQDVSIALQEWTSLGLMRLTNSPDVTRPPNRTETLSAVAAPEFSAPQEPTTTYTFFLGGLEFLLRFSDEQLRKVVTVALDHLRATGGSPSVTIDVFRADCRCIVSREGTGRQQSFALDEVAPAVAQEALTAVCEKADSLICIHAAVHSMGKDCIVFPGMSGTGKTTLSVALMNAGFRYFTDEVALLDSRTRRILPVPVSLRVKEGSWRIAASMFPELSTLDSYLLSDGSRLRLLPPRSASFARTLEDSGIVRCLVFPSYSPEHKTAIEPLPRVEALRRIQKCGYFVSGRLDRATMAHILEWIQSLDCYEMRVNSLSEAVAIIRGLLE